MTVDLNQCADAECAVCFQPLAADEGFIDATGRRLAVCEGECADGLGLAALDKEGGR